MLYDEILKFRNEKIKLVSFHFGVYDVVAVKTVLILQKNYVYIFADSIDLNKKQC